MESFFYLGLALLGAPLLSGIILTVKAFFVGKNRPQLSIKYYTIGKLLQNRSTYNTTSTLAFNMAPTVSFVAAIMPLLFFPFAGINPVVSFKGDVIVLIYVMAFGRVFMNLAIGIALSFEKKRATREAFLSILSETTIIMILVLFYKMNGSLRFAEYFQGGHPITLVHPKGTLVLIIFSVFMILLAENLRLSLDDPAMYKRLTMVSNQNGPDIAMIEMGAIYKILFYAAFLTCLLIPTKLLDIPVYIVVFGITLATVYVIIGLIESAMIRFKMDFVPKFILTSFALVSYVVILTAIG
jgi:formate hydrogenlyase subunit 4